MTLIALPVALLLVAGIGGVVTRYWGWRAGLGAAFVTMLLLAGIYAALVALITASMG